MKELSLTSMERSKMADLIISLTPLMNWGLLLALLGIIMEIGGRFIIPKAPNVSPWNLYLWDQMLLLSLLVLLVLGTLRVLLSLCI